MSFLATTPHNQSFTRQSPGSGGSGAFETERTGTEEAMDIGRFVRSLEPVAATHENRCKRAGRLYPSIHTTSALDHDVNDAGSLLWYAPFGEVRKNTEKTQWHSPQNFGQI